MTPFYFEADLTFSRSEWIETMIMLFGIAVGVYLIISVLIVMSGGNWE